MPIQPNQFNRKDWGIFTGGAVAFISLFLPWFGASVSGYNIASVTGWGTGYGWMAATLLVVAAVYRLSAHLKGESKARSVRSVVVVLSLSAVGLLLVLIRLGSLPHGSGLGGAYQYGARIGIIFAMIAGIAQVVCAGLLLRTARRGGIESIQTKEPAPTTA
jgi:hypothetical protein